MAASRNRLAMRRRWFVMLTLLAFGLALGIGAFLWHIGANLVRRRNPDPDRRVEARVDHDPISADRRGGTVMAGGDPRPPSMGPC